MGRNILSACEWAEEKHMIPIIDFEWEHVYKDGMIGIDNMWEYVFKNPLSINQAIKEKNVFVGTVNATRYITTSMQKKFNLFGAIRFVDVNWKEYFGKLNYYSNKWWQLQDDVLARFEMTYSQLFNREMKILGIALREEFSMNEQDIDMKTSMLERHPHHLNVDAMIDIIKKYKEKWGCTHIFVTTYIRDSIEKLQKEFGDTILFTGRERVLWENYKMARNVVNEYSVRDSKEYYKWLNSEDEYAKIMKKLICNKDTMIEYVEEIYGLSLCDCFLAGKSGGALAACIWNGGKYEELEILSDENKSELY